jgi:GTP-binding protein EngB required for normal cell division
MKERKTLIKIHVCGKIDERIIDNIFPENCNQKYQKENKEILIGDKQWKTKKFNWVAKIYNENNNQKNFSSLFNEIKSDSDLEEQFKIKKHIVLSFDDEDNELLFNELKRIGMLYLPRFIFITKNIGNYNLNKKSFITNILYSDITKDSLLEHIKDELWEIDCYFNEHGNSTSFCLGSNVMKSITVETTINILLTGVSRSGKSSFVNIINNNSLLALENSEKSSLTSKITEYKILLENKTEKDGYIKIIDTPGLNYASKTSNKDKFINVDEINKSISDLIYQYKKKDSLNDIHIILFFFNEGTTLDGSQCILEQFKNENYTVLFIINRSQDDSDDGESIDIRGTLQFLKNKNLENLAIRENIICCNIIKTRNGGFGLDNIFKRILEILRNDNPFYNDKELLKKMENCIEDLKKPIEGKEKEYELNLNKSLELKINIAKENKLFKTFISNDISIELDKCKQNADTSIDCYIGLTISSAFIPIPYTDLALTPTLQAIMIFQILYIFGINLIDLDLKLFIESLLGVGLREITHVGVNKTSKKVIEHTVKGYIVYLSNVLASRQGVKSISESIKVIPFLGFIIGAGIGGALNYFSTKKLGENTIKFCFEFLKKKGAIGLFYNNIVAYNKIFDQLKKFSEKSNWWEYNIKVIQKKVELNN